MVKVTFKLSEGGTVSLSLDKPAPLDTVVNECAVQAGIQLGGYIAIRHKRVISGKTLVYSEDEIDIFPAIAGG